MNAKRMTVVTAKALVRAARGDDGDNNARASWGEAGIIAADPDFGSNDTYTSVKDAVANICHGIRRMGLDPEGLLAAGLRSYEDDNQGNVGFGSGEPVAHDEANYPLGGSPSEAVIA